MSLTALRLLAPFRNLNAGECGGFDAADAAFLLERGMAELEQPGTTVPAEDFARIAEALENPPAPTPALVELMTAPVQGFTQAAAQEQALETSGVQAPQPRRKGRR